MAKEMTGIQRREKIIEIMEQSATPVSGTEFGRMVGVSRQVVVQDIALLKSQGYDIVSTARGYYVNKPDYVSRIIKVCHTEEEVSKELTTIIDLGGRVVNVTVNHRVYGKVSAPLDIRNRRDITNFVNDLKSGKSTALLNVTSGYHYHKIEADSEQILDEIESALKQQGFLADVLPYENIG